MAFFTTVNARYKIGSPSAYGVFFITVNAPPCACSCVRALVCVPGNGPENQMPARQLSPKELLTMKNKAGHTPVIKAFAGGVHVGVIR